MGSKSRRIALKRLAAVGGVVAGDTLTGARGSAAGPTTPAGDARDRVDCRDFAGLDRMGVRPSDVAINAAIRVGIERHLPVFLPAGTYRIDNPLIANPLAVEHAYANLQFCGAGGLGSLDPIGFPSRAATVIAPTFKDRPALALDLMSGAIFKNFAIQGQNTAPNDQAVPTHEQARYISAGCRNNRYSPYCAISIDAFNSTALAAADRYPGMSDRYFLSGGGSSGITFENLWIANFVVGIAYGISGLAANTEDILFQNVWISRTDSCYAVGHTEARHCMMQMGNLGNARQGIDGYQYGTASGCPPKFHRVNHGYLYRIFTLPNGIGGFVLDDNYAEAIRTLGNFGLGANYSRQPLSFSGGAYTITSRHPFDAAPPPLFLETYSPTVFKGVMITRDGNSAAVDALNVVAVDATCSFEQCYLPGTGVANVPPFIGLVKDLNHVQCRITDCHVGADHGGSMTLSDDSTRAAGIAAFAPGGRFLATYQTRRTTDGAAEYVFQPSASNDVQRGVAAGKLTLSSAGAGALQFETSDRHVLVGDVLFWRMRAQGTSLNQWIVPALKVTAITGARVDCRLLFEPAQYDTVAAWNEYNNGTVFVAVRQWAPARSLTCNLHDATTITALSAPGILIGNGPEVAGDWVLGDGIPPNTRVISVDAETATAVLSQATTGGPATNVKLYFGRLYAPSLTPAF